MSYGDYEIKVRDATTNEPWGASSKLMLEIAEATHSYQGFNEVMETILKRFQEPKEKWRCVYKALTLLEYLVKHGAERVIDFARDHIYDIKALKNFHYVSDKGKDEGLNGKSPPWLHTVRSELIVDLGSQSAQSCQGACRAACRHGSYQGGAQKSKGKPLEIYWRIRG